MRVAAAQIDIVVADKRQNHDTVERVLREAAARGVELVVFPECSLTGYVITDTAEVEALAEEVPGESSARVVEVCAELNIAAVVGLLERVEGLRRRTRCIYPHWRGVPPRLELCHHLAC